MPRGGDSGVITEGHDATLADLDLRATVEDFTRAFDGLGEVIQASRSIVADSRRRRLRRHSLLRLVPAQH